MTKPGWREKGSAVDAGDFQIRWILADHRGRIFQQRGPGRGAVAAILAEHVEMFLQLYRAAHVALNERRRLLHV